MLSNYFCWPSRNYEKERIQTDKQQIKKILKSERKKYFTTCKLLLLGTGESGKSTFRKQIEIIHGKGFSDEYRMNYVKNIYHHIFTSMKALVNAMDDLRIPYSGSFEILECVQLIKRADFQHVECIGFSFKSALKRLWADDGIQACYRRRNEYQITDSIEYFFDDIDRFADPNYLPTHQDILRTREETKGIVQVCIKVKDMIFEFVDVGGQRSERGKWLNIFDNSTAIIFIAALSEYDQSLKEVQNQNRLMESHALFKTIIQYPFFHDKCIVLFLNKKDLLEEKIMFSNLADYFSDFKGPQQDAEAAKGFILDLFVTAKEESDGGSIYHHFTCATDTENMRFVTTAVNNTILNMNLILFNMG